MRSSCRLHSERVQDRLGTSGRAWKVEQVVRGYLNFADWCDPTLQFLRRLTPGEPAPQSQSFALVCPLVSLHPLGASSNPR